MGEPRAPWLEVADVTVAFGGLVAVNAVDLTIEPGEAVGIIGPNGAGKTTLLDAISGFVESAGDVRFRGRDITRLLPHQRARLGIGRSFQDARLYPTMTVRDVLATAFHAQHRSGVFAEGLRLRGARAEEQRIRALTEKVIDLVDLERYLDHRISELSFGTTRAAELAWLAAQEPDLLLLDEPASGLQQSEVRSLGPLIDTIRGDAAMIVIDHDVPFVSGLADRLVAMDLGRVIADGAPDDVLADPVVITSYLGGTVEATA